MKDDYLESSVSSDGAATPETPRSDKKQPIIIQNFDLLPPGKEKFRRKPLAVANLYLSAVMLSRRNVKSEPENQNLTEIGEPAANELFETRPGLYKSFGPSSSVSGTPSSLWSLNKIRTKKQVTFVEGGHRSSPVSAAAQIGDSRPSAVKTLQPRPVGSMIDGRFHRENSVEVSFGITANMQKSSSSIYPQSTSLYTPDSVVPTESSFQGFDSALTFSPKSQFSENSSSSDASRSDSISRGPGFHQAGSDATDEPSGGNGGPRYNTGFVKIPARDGNDNKSPSDNFAWYEKEKPEIESRLKASRDDSNRSHPHNNKTRDSESENKIGIDTVCTSTQSEASVPRKLIRVNFLKDDVHIIQRANTTFPKDNIQMIQKANTTFAKDNIQMIQRANTTFAKDNIQKIQRANTTFSKDNIQVIQRANTTFPRHKKVHSHVDAQKIVPDKDNREGSVNDSEAFSNESHVSNKFKGQRSKVDGNATFLMQYYSHLGERRTNQDNLLDDGDRRSAPDYTDKVFVQVVQDVPYAREVSRTTGPKASRAASSISEARPRRFRAFSCSAMERSPRTFANIDGAASAERFLLGSDFSLSARRTVRNKLLEEFIMGTTKSSSQTAVEKRLKPACPS